MSYRPASFTHGISEPQLAWELTTNLLLGTARELPDRVIYAPDMQAIALALHLLNGDLQ